MHEFSGNLIETLSRLAFPKIGIIDIIQIALIAFFVYQFMVWIKYTHAYTLLKGILAVSYTHLDVYKRQKQEVLHSAVPFCVVRGSKKQEVWRKAHE